jgi:formate/nitrite transporter FocA (FNT family)
MTVMTWFVEGAAESMGVRIVMAWIVGFVLLLGSFNHAIVGTLEMFYGIRAGAPIGYDQLFSNLGIAIASNLVGGLVLVTFARSAQALGAAPD